MQLNIWARQKMLNTSEPEATLIETILMNLPFLLADGLQTAVGGLLSTLSNPTIGKMIIAKVMLGNTHGLHLRILKVSEISMAATSK